jgi:hypothetical protein
MKRGASGAVGGLLTQLTRPITRAVADAATLAGWGVAVAIPTAVAFVFFLVAAFVWAEKNYGTVEAALLLGAIFLLIAGSILLAAWVYYRRSREHEQVATASSPPLWKDPAILSVGIELVRIVGIRRIIPVIALGAAIAAALEVAPKRRRADTNPR